jgi:hypothetical protein
MQKKLVLTLLLMVAILVGLVGCNMPNKDGDMSEMDLLQTAAQETVMARLTETASGDTQASPTIETGTATETATLIPSATTAPPTGVPPTPLPCNWVAFMDDVTYPDNAQVTTGTSFVKTWRLKNIGTCTWTSGYRLIFSHGDRMDAPNEVQITSGSVAPGALVDVSVNLVAPASTGTYQGNFLLRSSDNVVFGLGGSANTSFWVKVVAVAPNTPTPTATATATATTEPKPDLYISEIAYNPAAPHQGDVVTVSVTTYNGGDAAAGAYTVEWYAAGPTLGCTWPVAGNNAHGGKVLTCTYTYGGWNHNYETKAIADTTNAVVESDETNNTRIQPLDVSP